jgi:hypothetical protein
MLCRWILVLLVAGAASGCFGDGGSPSTGASAASTADSVGSPAVHELTFEGIPATGVAVGGAYAYTPSVASNGAPVTYAIEGQPQWASFDATTGALTGTPGAGDEGLSADITITASDGLHTGSVGPFTIRVEPTASLPRRGIAPVISGNPMASAIAGQPYVFQPKSSDLLGKPLSYAISNRPSWATFSTATGLLSGTPSVAEIGAYADIQIVASDGTSAALLPAFTITVAAGSSATPAPGGPASTELGISGTPATAVVAGSGYRFTPIAADPGGAALTFSIQGAPAWATFDPATGELSGTHTTADVTTYANIIISVSDGEKSVSLPAFSISVTQSSASSVDLSWTVPTQNANGTALTNLAGYTIYYGTSADQLTESVRIANPRTTSTVISKLSPGTWYFSIVSFTTANEQSTNSVVASATVN